ncbi:MAG: hypothetical protein QNJ60_04590 [Xenococcaceae cyanobacterium MO_188.B19]|nr:hypothetical protein [Xenococcaceae cyanobacterium MO_188.B19]
MSTRQHIILGKKRSRLKEAIYQWRLEKKNEKAIAYYQAKLVDTIFAIAHEILGNNSPQHFLTYI